MGNMMCSDWKSGSDHGKGTGAKMHVKSMNQCENGKNNAFTSIYYVNTI